MAEKYTIHYWFEWGGQCLWSVGARTQEKFGYAINIEELPLSLDTIERTKALGRWHDTALNWDDPMAPSPWSEEESLRFGQAARDLLETLRKELGNGFDVLGVDDFSAPPRR
jgi:hypothetical protein